MVVVLTTETVRTMLRMLVCMLKPFLVPSGPHATLCAYYCIARNLGGANFHELVGH